MALKRIILRDFVIVQELELDLAGGFTVLTGETGAGKSILIDALQLATGARADAGVIREGAARTDVSVEFDTDPKLDQWLEDAGFDATGSVLLRRTVDLQGKSRGWINGGPATAGQLREAGEQLLDIHGQHAWQSLTRPDAVRGLLDAYARADAAPLALAWHQWRLAQKKLAQAQVAQSSLQNDRDRLAWQIGELEKLAPGAHEWDELNAEHSRLSNGQALLTAAFGALQSLDDSDSNALSLIRAAQLQLESQQHIEPAFSEFCQLLASGMAQLDDVARSLRAYLRKTEPDPERLAELDERVALWLSLSRRYKCSPGELAVLLASWKEELSQLDAAADLAALESAEQQLKAAYLVQAQALSQARHRAAPLLALAITQAMQGLGMAGGKFEVQLQATPEPQQSGLEEVSFLVAGHAGSSPRPVGKVASGGELSRMALAIAVTTSQLGTAQTLVFDEVDSGVGGAVAETVGRLMKRLGADRQVLAVTHLPQVAACADHHLLVAKHMVDSATHSSVSLVAQEQRVGEIARMLGGERLSDTTLAHAREMLSAHTDLSTP